MQNKFLQSGGCALFVTLLVCFVACNTRAQTNTQNGTSLGTVKGFSVPGDYFDPPFDQQTKSLIQGAEASPLPNGLVQLKGLKLTMFQTNGQPEMIVEAADCLFDTKERVASSPGPLTVRTADGRFSLEGEGFHWLQSDSLLNISNRVHSFVHQGTLVSPNELSQSGENLEVYSDHFVRDLKTGLSAYRDNVRIVGSNVTFTADALALTLPMTNDVITLKGRATWAAGQRNGGGDGLEIDRINKSMRATGNSFVKMPGTALGTNSPVGATTRSVEVLANNYEFRTNAANFIGHVRVTQFAGDKPAGKMTCGEMTAIFSPAGEIQSLLAENDVVVEQEDGRFTSTTAVFTPATESARFSGNPTWSKGERSGSGDVLLVDQARGVMTVRGDARMKLPGSTLSDGATTHATGDKFTMVTSDEYALKAGHAQFRGHVRIEYPQMKIASDSLTADSPTGGEQIERIVAENNVRADLMDSNGKPTHITGERARYTMNDGLLRLTGNPVVQNEQGRLTGSIIVWDRKYDLLIARNQKMTFREQDSMTNGFPNLLNGN